jgi:hypothetical protein
MSNPLVTTSILLHLEIRKWAGEVSDKKALKAVADKFNSDTHNDKYKKSLFVDDPLALIDRCAGRLRNHFYACTVPWLDGGKGRLIPSLGFQEFAVQHSQIKQEFYQEVEIFLANYEDHKELAEEKKGDMFNVGEYPTVAQLRTRFEINLTTLPFPNVDDFRITAPQAVIDDLETSVRESVARVQDVVSRELKVRFKERLAMLVKTLTVGKRFNASLLSELANVIHMAQNLEETISDSLISDMATIEIRVLQYTPDQLRNSVTLQDEVVEICNEVLSH